MPHKVLERLRVHSGLRHIGAVGVSADVGRDVGHLLPVDIVVPLYRMVEAVLPVHCYLRHSVLVEEQKSGVTADHLLYRRVFSVLNDSLKAVGYILGDGQFSRSGVRFGGLNDILHFGGTL